jgi:RNA polymerase sigma factor for flagellar operon FliA
MDDLSALVREYMPDVKRIAYRMRSLYGSRMPQEDLEQLGQMGLLHAKKTHDATKGELKPYVLRCIESEMRVAARTERRQNRVQRMWAAVAAGAHMNHEAPAESPTTTRRKLLEHAVIAYVLAEAGKDEGESPEDMFADEETHAHLKSLVEQLPERQRQCTKMYYFQGMSIPEIEAALGINRSNVSRALSAAAERLHCQLQPSPES